MNEYEKNELVKQVASEVMNGIARFVYLALIVVAIILGVYFTFIK